MDQLFNAEYQPLDINQTIKPLGSFQTPETCRNPETLQEVSKRIYNELLKLRELDKIDPQMDATY